MRLASMIQNILPNVSNNVLDVCQVLWGIHKKCRNIWTVPAKKRNLEMYRFTTAFL